MKQDTSWRWGTTLVALVALTALVACEQPKEAAQAPTTAAPREAEPATEANDDAAAASQPADTAKPETPASTDAPPAAEPAPGAMLDAVVEAKQEEEEAEEFAPAGPVAGPEEMPDFDAVGRKDLGPPLVDNADALVRLDPVFPVWLDKEKKRVVMVGEVVARQVPLEMLACPRQTKEHESILSIDTKAQVVHAGLLAAGAEPGHPVQFEPYRPAEGTVINIDLAWKDPKSGETKQTRAQEWVRNMRTGKAMEVDWVFGGSSFWKDEETGENRYMAEAGDMICVSNFSTAMLDLPVESSASASALVFEAFTERIPDLGTPVTLILTPQPGKKPQTMTHEEEAEEKAESGEAKAEAASGEQ